MGSSLLEFLVELRRRHVVRAGIVYGVVAFIVLQAADLLVPALLLPDWTYRLLAMLLILGFPVALALAYAFEVTPDGIRRTPSVAPAAAAPERAGPGGPGDAASPDASSSGTRRRGSLSRRSAVAAVALALLVAGGTWFAAFRSADGRGLVANRVVVIPLENATGVDSLDVVGRWAADWIVQELAALGVVEVVPASAVEASARFVDSLVAGPDAAQRVRLMARETGARIVVSGTVYRQADELQFRAALTDATDGRVVRALDPVSASIDAPADAFEPLRQRVVAAIAALHNTDFAPFVLVQSQPPSFEAYREFSEGSDLFGRGRFGEAVEHFATAAALDSSYTLPLLYRAVSHINLGDYAAADSVLGFVDAQRGRLAPYDRHFLEMQHGWLRGDYERVLEATRRIDAIAPGARTSFDLGTTLLRMNRPAEAIRELRRLDPERGELRNWVAYWISLGAAYHLLGRHRQEMAAARRAAELNPGSAHPHILQAIALAARGRPDEALGQLDLLLASASPSPAAVAAGAHRIAAELGAHGHPEQAAMAAARAVERLASLPPGEPDVDVARGRLLYFLGRHDEAGAEFRRVVEQLPTPDGEDRPPPAIPVFRQAVEAHAHLALLDAAAGRELEARIELERLVATRQPYALGYHKLWAANLAAALDEPALAVRLLREALGEGTTFGIWVHNSPYLDPLRGYPPFEELLRPKG
jgi:tetratricopeptide (TPR) repeat protein